jgi:hypothetical protein
LTAVFDLDLHELILATRTHLSTPLPQHTRKNTILFDTSDPGLTRRNFVIRPGVVRIDLPGQALRLCKNIALASRHAWSGVSLATPPEATPPRCSGLR